jgi:TrmH family RNA methyltransferase
MVAGSAPILVLVNPQDIVNIASAVRIARNFGIERMRLVDPEAFDPWRIEGIAHNSAEFVARIEILDSLAAAVADCVHVAVLTARGRTAERSESGPVAMVVGREDRGLTNAELDVGHVLVTIPTDPRSPSLNLAQAVAIIAYESWLARGGESLPLKQPRKDTPPATSSQLEELFGDWQRALWAVDFFKTRRSESVMRSFREVVHRAGLDGREASLVRAMGIEVVRYLERAGLPVGEPPLAGPS